MARIEPSVGRKRLLTDGHILNDGNSFFVEVGVERKQPLVLRSFVSNVPLEDYTHYMQLPEL
ncbi:MAG: hypothetical protein EOO63_00555 [Hymenobacter sp.]|nr:MAG: hypothetical protein EOO63_00555 [Hymenobacter sp.]